MTPGSSTQCTVDNSETPQCSNELYSDYSQTVFSSDQASRDLAYLIQNYSPSKSKIIVYGVSYGTLWLTRFVQNFPSLANGVIFDSVVSSYGSVKTTLDNWDAVGDEVLKKYFALCDADSYCSSKLPGGATNYVLGVLNGLYSNGTVCPAVLSMFPTSESLLTLMNSLLQSNQQRILIPALFYRINRCRSDDVALLGVYAPQNASTTVPCDPSYNQLLFNYVAFSELFNANLTQTELAVRNEALTFNAAISTGMFATRELWSTFFNWALFDKPISPATNVLVLGGQLDCQTPIEDTTAFETSLNVTNGQLIFGQAVNGNHAVILEIGTDGSNCGLDIVANFASNPSGVQNLSCLKNLLHYDFQGTSKLNLAIAYTSDLYDGDAQITETLYPQSVFIAMVVLAAALAVCTLGLAVGLAVYCGNKAANRVV